MSRKKKTNLKNEGKNHFETSKEKGLYSLTKQTMNFKKQVLSVMVVSRKSEDGNICLMELKMLGDCIIR